MCYCNCENENHAGECTASKSNGFLPCQMDESNEPDYDALSKDERSEIEAENVFIK